LHAFPLPVFLGRTWWEEKTHQAVARHSASVSPKEVTARQPIGSSRLGWVDGVIRTFDGLEALQVRSIQDWPDSQS